MEMSEFDCFDFGVGEDDLRFNNMDLNKSKDSGDPFRFPSSSITPPSQSQLQNFQGGKSDFVVKLLEGSQGQAVATTSQKDDDPLETERAVGEVPDLESYEVFSKLCISSHQNEPILKSQWMYIMTRLKLEEAQCKFDLTTYDITGFFHLCRKFETFPVVRFRALELYSRYIQMFTDKMATYFVSTKCSTDDFKEFEERFQAQILLRMCTCILIASKLHSDSKMKVLRVDQIRKILLDEKLKYSNNNIIKSEIRVLETLNYKCHWITPFDGIEQLLALLNLKLEVFQLAHYHCILLLEYFYSDLEQIQKRFRERSKSVTCQSATPPLRCAAIVAASLFIVGAGGKTAGLHKRVARAAQLNEDEVNDLAVIILDFLYKSK